MSKKEKSGNFNIGIDFNDVWNLLKEKGGTNEIISSTGTEYYLSVEYKSHNHFEQKVIECRPSGAKNGYSICEECWGYNIYNCLGTRTGGVYNGIHNIKKWYNDNK